ncbi:hypothetical protein GCM10010256_00470 [Streptomyces coeruleorubidus]|nr:hypothetical protein GCM10010256_00470 [Streptomyces coeruleorubidus]
MRGRGPVGAGRAHAAEPHMSQPRAPWAGTKRHIHYATTAGDCGLLPGSRMVTLIYPRLPVVHP